MPGPSLPVVGSAHELFQNLYAHCPSGWYFLSLAKDLPPGAVKNVKLGGRELVLFRTEGGKAVVSDPYCPHLGAHLGHGGCVKGETIECPFHKFRFGTDGRCESTGYGTAPPPRARLELVPVIERHGLVLAWHGGPGEAPWFDVPDVEMDGWSDLRVRTYRFRGHPQETNENSVDSGHFAIVHGYSKVDTMRELRMEGAFLSVQYCMERPRSRTIAALGNLYTEFFINVHGLGYSRVEVSVPEINFKSRHLVFATPIAPGELELTVGFQARSARAAVGLKHSVLGLPFRAIDRAMSEIGLDIFRKDVEQDFEIWKHKRYVHPPQLVEGDGPIGSYRRWCKQFYPQLREASSSRAAETAE